MLFAAPVLIGLVLGVFGMILAGNSFMGGQKFTVFLLLFVVGSGCSLLSVNPSLVSEHFGFLSNPMIVQAAAGVIAGVLSLVIIYLVGLFSGGGVMLSGTTSIVIIAANFALVFAAPYLVGFLPLRF